MGDREGVHREAPGDHRQHNQRSSPVATCPGNPEGTPHHVARPPREASRVCMTRSRRGLRARTASPRATRTAPAGWPPSRRRSRSRVVRRLAPAGPLGGDSACRGFATCSWATSNSRAAERRSGGLRTVRDRALHAQYAAHHAQHRDRADQREWSGRSSFMTLAPTASLPGSDNEVVGPRGQMPHMAQAHPGSSGPKDPGPLALRRPPWHWRR